MLVAIHFLVFYFELCVRYGKGDRDSFMCLLPLKNSVAQVVVCSGAKAVLVRCFVTPENLVAGK